MGAAGFEPATFALSSKAFLALICKKSLQTPEIG
jgi:hypothetical protein